MNIQPIKKRTRDPVVTRQAILEAASSLFAQQGADSVSVSAVANLAVRTRAGARFVHFVNERMEGAPGGPDEKERARSRAHTVAVARDSSGSILSEIHVKGPSVYDLTAELMAWAADELAHGRGQTPGVVGPIEAFGLETLVDACRTIGLAVV